jgi:hypothetical protein
MSDECGAANEGRRPMSVKRGTMSAGHGNAGLVETMMTADGLRLTAYGPGEDEIRIVEDLPKAKPPHHYEHL